MDTGSINFPYMDSSDVVNAYSTQLDKWIMMDPSFAGYFKDENDNFLGLSEVRERLINDDMLVMSNYLNHNGNKYIKSEYNYEAMNFNMR